MNLYNQTLQPKEQNIVELREHKIQKNLNGSPVTNSPLDLFAQCAFLILGSLTIVLFIHSELDTL